MSGTRNQMPRRTRSGRIKDWLLYVAIAVLIVISIWMFAMHQARTSGSPNLPLKWLGFGGMTAIVFGHAIRACRRLWGKQRFWLFLGLFFAVHSGLGVLVLLRVPVVPLLLYAVLTGPEYLLSAAYLGYFLDSQE
jgi:Na+/melibiose symporter-like transporter